MVVPSVRLYGMRLTVIVTRSVSEGPNVVSRDVAAFARTRVSHALASVATSFRTEPNTLNKL